jgi:hypothetical protein
MKHARDDYNRIQDPLKLIADNEPVFLLRAKDKCAPQIVEAWAALAEANGASKEMVKSARDHAILMRRWQIQNGNKTPDMPPNAGWDGPDAE